MKWVKWIMMYAPGMTMNILTIVRPSIHSLLSNNLNILIIGARGPEVPEVAAPDLSVPGDKDVRKKGSFLVQWSSMVTILGLLDICMHWLDCYKFPVLFFSGKASTTQGCPSPLPWGRYLGTYPRPKSVQEAILLDK